ncbi:MAG: MDR family MFS transporter [Blastocatellia bacterium]
MTPEELTEIEAVEAVEVPEPAAGEMNWRTIMVCVGVALGLFMGALENTIVGPAMPTIIATLNGIEGYGGVFATYILASTLMTPIWGKMADLIGRRPAMFGGLALFIIGSALSGLSQSMPQLLAFRTIQGLGAGALFPVGITIVADLLTLEKRTKMVGFFSGMWGLASLIGPFVGGWLTKNLSWHWVFYINLPFGLLAGAMIQWGYTERHARKTEIHLDYAGAVTLSAAMLILLVMVERAEAQSGLVTAAGVVVSLLLLAVFIRIERRSPEPLIPLNLFQALLVRVGSAHGLFVGAALIGTMSFLPLFVQAVLGTDATGAGRMLTPFILAWVVSSIIGSRLLLHVGYRPLVIIGMLLAVGGSFILARVSVATTRTELAVAVILLGLGGGVNMSTLMIGVQHAVVPRRMAVATSTVQFCRSIGAALGTGLMGALMNWRLSQRLAGGGAELSSLTGSGHNVSSIVLHSTKVTLSPQSAAFLQSALADSLRLSFIFVLVASVVATVIALFIPGGRARELAHPEHH